MSYITLGNNNQSIQGFNNYRFGGLTTGRGMGGMFYNGSIYGAPRAGYTMQQRYGNGSRFAETNWRSYNEGPVGTYYQFGEPEKPKDGFGKGLLNGILASMIGFGPLGSFAAGWLSMNNNAEKAENWISNIFKGSSNKA